MRADYAQPARRAEARDPRRQQAPARSLIAAISPIGAGRLIRGASSKH
jgi:hypothetical protein